MALPVPDRDRTLSSVAESSRRWTELLRSVRDPDAVAIGHWTVCDVAVHTSHIFSLFPELVVGGTSPIKDHLRLAEEWDEIVRRDPERDMDAIADRIERSTKEFIDRATGDAWTNYVAWHGGLRAPVYSLAGILINEAELHGRDVALTEGRNWEVGRDKAIAAIVALFPVLPYFFDSDGAGDLRAVYELRLRGGPRVFISIAERNLTIDTTPRRADCRLSVDPVDYLMIGFGRKAQWGPIATGKLAAWGRKPWLALRFSKLFHSP